MADPSEMGGPTLSVEERAAFLAKTALFEGLSDDQVELVAARVGVCLLDEGEILFHEGEPGDAVFFVVDGEIEIVRGEGEAAFVIAMMREGDLLGEIAALGRGIRTAAARARTRSTVVFLKAKALTLLIQQAPAIAHAVFRILADRLAAADDCISAMREDRPAIARFTIEGGEADGRVHEMRTDEAVIGRETGSAIEDAARIAIPGAVDTMGLRQVEIVRREGSFYAQAIEVSPSTTLNDEPLLGAIELVDGDRLGVGGTTLVFRPGGA